MDALPAEMKLGVERGRVKRLSQQGDLGGIAWVKKAGNAVGEPVPATLLQSSTAMFA
jgi:hypothetical protein